MQGSALRTSAVLLFSLALALGAGLGCEASSPPPAPVGPPPPAKPCEEAFADLARYFTADPERRRPPGFREDAFVGTCKQLPVPAQECMLFSWMQKHANECDKILAQAPPEILNRLAQMSGK